MVRTKQLDADLINFFTKYDAATINEIASIFYRSRARRYDYAQKKLHSMEKKGILKSTHMPAICGEKVYYLEKVPCAHDLYFVAFYSKIYEELNGKVNMFKCYPQYLDGEVRPDAYVIFEIDDHKGNIYECNMFLEIDFTHLTDLEKYRKLDASGCCRTPDIDFPFIVVITGASPEKEYTKIEVPVIFLKYDLSDFNKKFIEFLFPDEN